MIGLSQMNNHIKEPEVHAQSSGKTPDYGMATTRADVLSQVLTLIRLRGELVYSAQLRGPWCITFPRGAAHFYFVESGTMWVKTSGAEPIKINQGDMVLLPHGTGHLICTDPATPAIEIGSLISEHFDRDKSVLEYGGDGVQSHLISGLFHFEGSSLAALMAALPLVVHLPCEGGKTPDWLHALTHFLLKESHEVEPGSSLMISRLIDLLVIRTLRTWAASQKSIGGWVGALGDERIGRALSAIHASPYHPWTVKGLASISAMSRSIFAERFKERVGEAPLHYINRLKLTLAADMLSGGNMRVTQVAHRIGYASDAAFSRAFKAQFGYAPSEASQRQAL